MHYWLVMPAAGAGRRFGSAKQYAALGSRTVLDTALQLFRDDARCTGGSLVLAPDDEHRSELSERLRPRFAVAAGGGERAQSVCNGLAALTTRAAADDWVLVHDAARPCLSAADLNRLLEVADTEPVGALLAVPVADTVKRASFERHPHAATAQRAGAETDPRAPSSVGAEPRVAETLSRDSLWLAQTPQMFRYRPLREALEQALAAQRSPTDEAQAMEWCGYAARLVQARDSNLKVTGVADLALAAAILAARKAA